MTVNSFQKETKTAPKGPVLFCLVYQRVFGYSPTFSDSFRRLSKTTEDSQKLAKISEHVRRLPKISNGAFQREIRTFSAIFLSLMSHVKDIKYFYSVQILFFNKNSQNTNSISPETVNIEELANLTANTEPS